MSVTIIADLEIKPEKTSWVITFLQAALPETRKSQGCISAELHRNQDDPNNLIIYQVFDTKEDYQVYMTASIGHGDQSSVEEYFGSFERPAEVRYFDHLEA